MKQAERHLLIVGVLCADSRPFAVPLSASLIARCVSNHARNDKRRMEEF